MFGSGLKLDKDLVTRAKRYADLAGYSSVEEFITHIVERQLEKLSGAESEEEMRKKLKGLGYIS